MLIVLAALALPPSVQTGTAAARQLRWSALDQEAELRGGHAIRLLERAIAADRSYFPAYYDYIRLMQERGANDTLRRRFAETDRTDGQVARCISIVSRGFDGVALSTPSLRELQQERARNPNTCALFYLALHESGESAAARTLMARTAAAQVPELGAAWSGLLHLAFQSQEEGATERDVASALRQRLHPLERTRLLLKVVELRERAADTTGARTVLAAIAELVVRDARPGLRLLGLQAQSVERTFHERLAIVRSRGAWSLEFGLLDHQGHLLVDRGDPLTALSYHVRQIAIADSVGSPDLQLQAYMRRGRAYAKLGRPRDAERDLVRAISAGNETIDSYNLIESYHNLAHTYESESRWPEAVRAIEEVVRRVRPRSDHGQRVMSLHDAGSLRWKAGWHAAARRDFEEMVRVIDQSGIEEYWAGEYFERVGDLERAITYYRRGNRGGNQTRSLAAQARVFEEIGYTDSAAIMAQRHDRLAADWQALETPLQPALLARRGRVTEAIVLARAWAERQTTNRNLHGAAIASLELAEFLLLDNRLPEALAETVRAERIAVQLNLVDELIRARRLQAIAQIRLGDRAEGLRVLRAALRTAERNAAVRELLSTQVALADATAASGGPWVALVEYDAAARTVEKVTAGLGLDRDRAGYRDRHLAAYDGALRQLIHMPSTARSLEAVAQWSSRRKAASLALAMDGAAPATRSRELSIRSLHRALTKADVVLDYLVLDSVVAVLAVDQSGARLIRLSATETTLRNLVTQLRAPLVAVYNGRIDTGRARFDLAAANALYRALVEPVIGQFPHAQRLIISPDGPLHYLPFETLVMSPPPPVRSANRYLASKFIIDDYEVEYLPSAEWIARSTASRNAVRGRLLVLSGDAPEARREAAVIQAAWSRDPVTVLDGGSATETALRSAREYELLHVASHAHADGRDPLASHLRLRRDAQNDGYFHLSEIMDAPGSLRLVVLSACETNGGPLYRGEGLFGLARGFLGRGTAAVVATQWPIGAATSDIMGHFYRGLSAGAAPVTALRAARLAARRAADTANPLFWGPLVLLTGG